MLTRCAVLGDPIAHSLSPALHRAGYAENRLAWEYDAHRVGAGELTGFLAAHAEEFRGLSVTMPLKREALQLADRVSPAARLAGGANTLVREDGGWFADNTDLPGAVDAVRERYSGRVDRVSVIGAGATAASTALAMVELGARRITVLARDAERAGETVATIAAHPAAPRVGLEQLAWAGETDLLISTVPAAAQTEDLVARWTGVPALFEVVYDPWPTPLVAALSTTDDTVIVSGLDLLIHQAVRQFELFTGTTAPLEAMRAAGRRALSARV
ncbi:shikimate dehydrogenase [Nocardioides insulae]|uniref:shikimate dehydrogenase n=1 Tax=Nocardioides insulae TaxID=394734 RepID=UPI000424FD55|nr:shikimate dehydrogenase [Nocardioides insulae]